MPASRNPEGGAPAGCDGVLVVDKPAGPTSHDIVAAVRRRLRGAKVGHTGTLDPFATGVLPLVVGRATRLARFLTAADKEYDALIRLGRATDTCDLTGRVTFEAPAGFAPPAPAAVAAAIDGFVGTWMQTPPAYSAKLAGGVRAYEQARRGEAVDRPPARVTVSRLELLSIEGPLVRVRLVCSAGFYVRAFADAVGRELGTRGCLDALRRLRSGSFTLAEAVPVAALDAGGLDGRLLPLESLLPEWPAVGLTAEGAAWAAHGRDLGPAQCRSGQGSAPAGSAVRLFAPDGRLVALAEGGAGGILHPSVVLV